MSARRTIILIAAVLVGAITVYLLLGLFINHKPDHYERENIAGFDCLVHVQSGGRTVVGCEGIQINKTDGG